MSLLTDTRSIQLLVGVRVDGIYGPVTAAAVRAELETRLVATILEEPPAKDATEFVFDARTERMLGTLDPKAVPIFERFIVRAQAVAAIHGCDYLAISGHRTAEEQNRIYAQGRTAPGPKVTSARAWQSNHNYGIALDFGVFQGRRYLDDAEEAASRAMAEKVHRAAGALAPAEIEWGGTWRKPDLAQYEIVVNLTLAEKKQLYLSKGSVL